MVLASTLFVGLVLGLGYFQMPVADDLIYLKAVNDHGVWKSVLLLRNEWNTRWTAILVNQIFLNFIPKPWLGIVYQSTTLLLILAVFRPIINVINTRAGQFQKLFLSLFFGASLFLLSFGHSDSWFWMCSQPAYLWATLIAFWMISRAFTNQLGIFATATGILAHVYVGGSTEVIALSALIIEGSLFIFRKRIPYFNTSSMVMGIFALTASMAFAFSGQGAQIRYEYLPAPNILEGSIIAIKSYFYVLFVGVGSKLPIIALIALTLFPFGRPCTNRGPINWIVILGIGDSVLMITFLITAYTLGDVGPNRVLIHISMILLILAVLPVLHFSDRFEKNRKVHLVGILSNILLTGHLSFLIYANIPLAKAYSEAIIKREHEITEQLAEKRKTIVLTPLPEAGLLFRAEIGNSPNEQNNHQLSTIYGEELEFTLSNSK